MGNIMTYLDEYGGYSFEEKPFGPVDGLVMAHFSYYVFDGIVPVSFGKERAVKLRELEGRMDPDHFISVTWERTGNRELFYKIIQSRRFRSTAACCYVNETDEESGMQFSAITLLLGNGDIYIAFRGTDDALIGWKEDFYMAYRTPVAAQERSRTYFEEVAHLMMRKRHARFYLGGHSKGGNLAVYAAITCKDKLKRRIGAVYNYDGPGFRPDHLDRFDKGQIEDKIIKYIPSESFVGMLMQGEEKYILIESSEIGVLQHIPLSWKIEGSNFVISDKQDMRRMQLYRKMNTWLFALDREKIKGFLDSFFELLETTQAQTLSELPQETWKNWIGIWNAYRNLDQDTKEIMRELCVFLIQIAAKDQKERVVPRIFNSPEKITF